jgi:hypothetical protein
VIFKRKHIRRSDSSRGMSGTVFVPQLEAGPEEIARVVKGAGCRVRRTTTKAVSYARGEHRHVNNPKANEWVCKCRRIHKRGTGAKSGGYFKEAITCPLCGDKEP